MAQQFHESLAAALPKDSNCNIRYITTPPKSCDPLFSPPPGHDPEKTRLASHFLAVSVPIANACGPDPTQGDVLLLGIEILVYTTPHLTTIFVSKADSTGYQPSQKLIPVRTIATVLLDWLATQHRRKHPGRQVVISLFARAQAQYLFPGSSDNGKKHVLDDRQLIKWWAKVLDPILRRKTDSNDEETTGAWVTVPGYEGGELRQFFPPSSPTPQSWKPGNPLSMIAGTRGVSDGTTPRTLLPRFPDDPKARFMQDLDDEIGMSTDPTDKSPSKQKAGKWKNINNLDRFWEAMEFRQECSSGRMVGFLWLVITPKDSHPIDDKNVDSQGSMVSVPSNPPSNSSRAHTPSGTPVTGGSPRKQRRRPLNGPIVSRQPRLKGGSSSLNAGTATASDLNGMLNSVRGDGLILTREGYDQAIQTLLNLDFGTAEVAARSTAKWVEEVRSIGGLSGDWSVSVLGTAAAPAAVTRNGVGGGAAEGQVNDLGSMVRKKRKVVDGAAAGEGTQARRETPVEPEPGVNVLGAAAIRKKPKPAVS